MTIWKRARIAIGIAMAAALAVPMSSAHAQLTPAAKAELEALLAGSTGETRFTPPGPAIDPSSLKGKLIFTIPTSTAIPFCDVVDKQMDEFAQKLGIRHEVWQTTAQLGQWVQGFNTAFAHKADLINVACGLDPATVAPQIKEAISKGIPVVAAHTYANGQTALEDLSGIVYGAYIESAKLEAAWVMLKTDGKANALVITAPSTANSPYIEKAILGMFEKYCPSCKVRAAGVNAADWATKIGPTVQSAILADRSLNYVIPIYDGMVQFVVPAIITTGASTRVKVASFNNTPAVLDMIRTGNVVDFDSGEDTTWLAGAILDQDMRVLLKQPLVKDYVVGVRAFTKKDVEAAGVPAKYGVGYGDAAQKGYE
ncbi:MAG: substrate-binding domain-containing protein, partial [Rhodospirillales bacterium]|nr:substrate-binding domain-containing protein [Rhodospirillales bacterium]